MLEEFEILDCMPKVDGKTKSLEIEGVKLSTRVGEFLLRDKYIREGMYSFVSWKWVVPFSEWIGERKVLEVMAGRGILSYALRQKGIDIIATDNFSWGSGEEEGTFRKWKIPVTEVENIDAVQAIEKYGRSVDIVIMSWPPYENVIAEEVLARMSEVNPKLLLVYIGEGREGCTGTEEFFNYFKRVKDSNFEKVARNYERWKGFSDEMMLGRYDNKVKLMEEF